MCADLVSDSKRFREMATPALDLVERYYSQLSNMPVMPVTTARAVHDLLYEPLPQEASTVADALEVIQNVVYPLSRHNGHPRFFGYVASPGTAAAAIGDLLTAGLNANVTSWRSAPAASEMEHLVIDWLKTMIGFSAEATGLFVSGGSMANFSALAAARTSADPEMGRLGCSEKSPLKVYISEEGHFSTHKAARLLGIGSDNVESISTDASFRIDIADLERRIEADRHAGLRPMCIVANAGTTNTGAVDPIEDLADVAERNRLWLHVDGAYGGFSALAPSAHHLFAGIERADSVSLDPHKWLYTSVGCGCILYRNPQAARATFAQDAEYTRPLCLSRDEAFAFWDFGLELSRPFRALTVWLQIKLCGIRNLAAAIEGNLACAQYFGRIVERAEDFELLAPVGLSVFCFRFRPRSYSKDLDALNQGILVKLQHAGSSYLSNARIRGKFALRGCVLNYRTTIEDMDRLFEDVQEAAKLVMAG